jgi:hypothetical protein
VEAVGCDTRRQFICWDPGNPDWFHCVPADSLSSGMLVMGAPGLGTVMVAGTMEVETSGPGGPPILKPSTLEILRQRLAAVPPAGS